MQHGSNSRKIDDISEKKEALVIYIHPNNKKENVVSKKKLLSSKTEKNIPLFYTDPIFKAKKYDFL